MRITSNTICTLLGMPPVELAAKLGKSPIPESPSEVVVGIPADLIRRRPDVRSAERLVAAQNAQIGVAESDFYPAFFITGSLGYEAKNLSQLFASKSFTGQIGPSFQWNILNYGRILNNVRFQDFKTQELVGAYQQRILTAAQEVENGIARFLSARDQVVHLAASVEAAKGAVRIANDRFNQGEESYTAVFVAEQFLVQQQDLLAQAQGDVALGLIQVYRALGGGWEFRLTEEGVTEPVPIANETPPRQSSAPPVPSSKQRVQSSEQNIRSAVLPTQSPEQAIQTLEQPIQSPERERQVQDAKSQEKLETRRLRERKLLPADGPLLQEDSPVITSKI